MTNTKINDSISAEDMLTIINIMSDLHHLLDKKCASNCVIYFSDNSTVIFDSESSNAKIIKGLDDISKFLIERDAIIGPITRHCLSNHRFTQAGKGAIRASAILTLYLAGDKGAVPVVKMIADVNDLYARFDGQWKIVEHRITPVF